MRLLHLRCNMVEIHNYDYQSRFFSNFSDTFVSIYIHLYVLSFSLSLSRFFLFPFVSLFLRPYLFALSHPTGLTRFPSRYTFDKVIVVHYPGRSFMAVIYDYYYCAVMVTAIAWLPHIEKLFLQQRKGGTLHYESCNLPRFFSRSNFTIRSNYIIIENIEAFNYLSIVYLSIFVSKLVFQ